jgi:hypothetical protein
MPAIYDNKLDHWATGLCECCSDPVHSGDQCSFFCGALFCQCCALGRLQQHAGLFDECCTPCCFYCCLSGTMIGTLVPQFTLLNLHRAVIEEDNIKESFCSSLCKVICCFACTMSQVNNQFILKNVKFEPDRSSSCCTRLFGHVGGAHLVQAVPAGPANNSIVPPMTNSMSDHNGHNPPPPKSIMPAQMMPARMQPALDPALPIQGRRLLRPTSMRPPPKSVRPALKPTMSALPATKRSVPSKRVRFNTAFVLLPAMSATLRRPALWVPKKAAPLPDRFCKQ